MNQQNQISILLGVILIVFMLIYYPSENKIDLTIHEIWCEYDVDENNRCVGTEKPASTLKFIIWPETGMGSAKVVDSNGSWFVPLISFEKCSIVNSSNWLCIHGNKTSVWTEHQMLDGYYTRTVKAADEYKHRTSHRGLMGIDFWYWYMNYQIKNFRNDLVAEN